jgi:hypothetical protein
MGGIMQFFEESSEWQLDFKEFMKKVAHELIMERLDKSIKLHTYVADKNICVIICYIKLHVNLSL